MTPKETILLKYREDAPITIGTVVNSAMLDGSAVVDFGAQVLRYVAEHKGLNLLLDFEQVEYLSSAALTELIKAKEATVTGGGSARICGLSPQIQKVFEITKFDKAFEIVSGEKVAHAVTRFKRSIELAKQEQAWEDG